MAEPASLTPSLPPPQLRRQIAEAVHITTRTAATHGQHILSKLRLQSRNELAVWFMQHARGFKY
jgi:hypothetical protein